MVLSRVCPARPLICRDIVLRSPKFVNDVDVLAPLISRTGYIRAPSRRLAPLLLALVGVIAPEVPAERVKLPAVAALPRPASSAGPVFTGPPVNLRVFNFTGHGVDLVWMNPNGAQENRGVLPPTGPGAAPALVATFGGHLWLFKSEGRVLHFCAATNQPVQDVQVIAPVAAGPEFSPNEPGARMRVAHGLVVPDEIPVAGLVAPPLPSGPLPAELEDAPEEAHEFLLVHNVERARLGIPPLRWSPKLAKYAQKWAKHLASSDDLEHRDRSEAKYGENLFRGTDHHSAGYAARLWLEERTHYRGGSVAREELRLIGHYTQMIWQETTHVGFGIARGPKGFVVVANYSPGGNRSREVPYARKK